MLISYFTFCMLIRSQTKLFVSVSAKDKLILCLLVLDAARCYSCSVVCVLLALSLSTYRESNRCSQFQHHYCRLGGSKSIRPVKTERWGVDVLIYLERGAHCLHMVHCIPKAHHLLPHLNPDWFYLSGTGLPGLSWKRGR